MSRRRSFGVVVVLALLAPAVAIGCEPEFVGRESLVTDARVLAIRGEPPEVRPGETARYSVLVATPDGPVETPLVSWAFCATPRLLTENGVASAACLEGGVRPIADGATVEAPIPADACTLFGPEVATVDLRPRDADVSGGFYQPLRVRVFAAGAQPLAFGLERLFCKLANASAQVATDFGARYLPNKNPELAVTSHTPLDAIPRGTTITLRATWPESAVERYPVYDRASGALVEHRESMRVSWFVTAGSLASDRTGRTEDELDTFSENAWTAPGEARTTHLFVVLRDARGGTAFGTYTLVSR